MVEEEGNLGYTPAEADREIGLAAIVREVGPVANVQEVGCSSQGKVAPIWVMRHIRQGFKRASRSGGAAEDARTYPC